MKLHLITEFDEVKKLYPSLSSRNYIAPKSAIEPGEYGLILKRGDQIEQNTLFAPTLVSARWGLVPNEFCSTNDADKFGMHQIRFERIKYSRPISNIYPAKRCVIPARGLTLDTLDSLEVGTACLLAGVWTQFLRPSLRIQSFGVLTRQRTGGREAVVLEQDQAERWLNPNSSKKELKAIAEGWWEQDLFNTSPGAIKTGVGLRLEFQPAPTPVFSKMEVVPDVKLEVEFKAKFSPGDQVRYSGKKIGNVLEVQSHHKHGVLVGYPDGLELWHSSRELHRTNSSPNPQSELEKP